MIGNPAVDLRLELVRYIRPPQSKRRNDAGGASYHSKTKNGFVHPANWDPANGITNPSGSNTGGGTTNNVAGARISEWAVTSEGQAFDIDLGAYFKAVNVTYRDASNGSSSLTVAKPTGVICRLNYHNSPRALKAYSRAKQPGYFAFRYSIIDPDNARERIYGAQTEVMVASNSVEPFYEDFAATQNFGAPCANQNVGFDLKRMACWIGKQQVSPNV
jgi:hypothetical protein